MAKSDKLHITMHMEALDNPEACMKVFCTLCGCPDNATLSAYLVEKTGALKPSRTENGKGVVNGIRNN